MKLFHQLQGAKHMPQGHYSNNHHNNKELKNYRLPGRKNIMGKKFRVSSFRGKKGRGLPILLPG
jgi:hypothetical protein